LGRINSIHLHFLDLNTLSQSTTNEVRVLTSFAETTDYFFFEVVEDRTLNRYIFDKSLKSFIRLASPNEHSQIPKIENDFDSGPDFWSTTAIDDSILVSVLYPEEFVDSIGDQSRNNTLKGQMNFPGRITAESNPVLMFIKIIKR